MECISYVSYSVMVNGVKSESFCPSRGLRQGDPLSPYLFLICTDWLSSLLRKADVTNKLKGVAVCKGAPKITHLLFVDDNIFFCEADDTNCLELSLILAKYEQASGQQINLDKS